MKWRNGHFLKFLKNHENNRLWYYQCYGELGKASEDFKVNLSFLGWFLVCFLLESFIEFLVNHYYQYYEPLSWFIIDKS